MIGKSCDTRMKKAVAQLTKAAGQN